MAEDSRRGKPRRSRAYAAIGLVVLGILAGLVAGQDVLNGTFAVFTDTDPVTGNTIGTGRIFSGSRTTPIFNVTDVSSGSAGSASSATAFADGSYFLTRAWGASFDSNRYIEADFNSPLPGGLDLSSQLLNVVLASNAGGGSVCYYVELRHVSTGSVISTIGSAGSPAACSSGTTWSTHQYGLSAMATTDTADDARIRIYATESTGAAVRLDALSISASTPYSSFTLYPTLTREQYSGTTELIYWALSGQ